MAAVWAYPGTFCPPHRGHVDVAKRMAEISGEVIVVCSVNPGKDDIWFTPEACKHMWQTYDLGKNIIVMTFDEFMAGHTADRRIVMVRGIRDEKDVEFEKKVLEANRRDFNINDFHYIAARQAFKKLSSTKARKRALKGNFKKVARMTNPTIAAMMIARAKQIKKERRKN